MPFPALPDSSPLLSNNKLLITKFLHHPTMATSRMVTLLVEIDTELKTLNSYTPSGRRRKQTTTDCSTHALLRNLQSSVKNDTVTILVKTNDYDEATVCGWKNCEIQIVSDCVCNKPYKVTVPQRTALRILAYAGELLKVREKTNPEWVFTLKTMGELY